MNFGIAASARFFFVHGRSNRELRRPSALGRRRANHPDNPLARGERGGY
jgi:hypothetical protein